MLKNCRFLPFPKNFVNQNGIKRVNPFNFSLKSIRKCKICTKWPKNRVSWEKIEFQGGKASFKLFGKIEFPSKRTKKAWIKLVTIPWINRIGEGSFKEAPSLAHLDLSANRFLSLEQETFTSLKDLTSLNLAENQMEDINGLLTSQPNLKWLNLSMNHLAWFDYAFIPPGKDRFTHWTEINILRVDMWRPSKIGMLLRPIL